MECHLVNKKILIASLAAVALLAIPADSADISSFPSVASITALRQKHPLLQPSVYLAQYNPTTKKGGGAFHYSGAASCTDDNGVLIQAQGGCYRRITEGKPYNVTWFGAQCGGVQIINGVSTSGSPTVTSASNLWTVSMIGWVAVVNKAASSSQQLVTTVTGFNSAGSLALATNAGASGTAETISVYPDDTTAIANTFLSANLNGADVTLPSGDTCGFANPGSWDSTRALFKTLYLNGGRLWLGMTGPVTDSGVSLVWNVRTNAGVQGPGTIDGLYQTNQGIQQTNANAVIFNQGDHNFIRGHVIIQNTKGRAFASQDTASNFSINDVTANDCGDFEFVPTPPLDPQTGRSMCGQLDSPRGHSFVSNFHTERAAQSGILISSFGIPSDDPLGSVTIENMGCKDAGFYCVDLEDYQGVVTLSNVTTTVTTGVTLTTNKIYGGYIFRAVRSISGTNLSARNSNTNAWTALMSGGADVWSFNNVTLQGTVAAHAAEAHFTIEGAVNPQSLSIADFRTDTFSIYSNTAVACSTANPMNTLVRFRGLKVSHLAAGTYDTTFQPQGNASTMVYFSGRDSDLGRVQIASLGTNVKASLYDFQNVIQTAPTFTGATASATYGTTTWSAPFSFSCP